MTDPDDPRVPGTESDAPPPSFSVEQEGRIALLLRDLAHAENDDARAPLYDQLRELTGCDHDDRIRHWLQWYVEDHLGFHRAIGILAGLGDAPEGQVSVPLLEEQVFERAEYNWCALEKITNKDDMLKLRMLYRDLESPLRTADPGPFSFARLSAADSDDLAFFEGKSLTEVLFDPGVQLRHLRTLKNYGKMMMMPALPSPTQRAGALVYAASISQGLVRFNTKITSLSFHELGESLPALMERPYIIASYADLFRAALAMCR